VSNSNLDVTATIYLMIRYCDYDGPQIDVVNRDGAIVAFDRDAARDMARHAHMLAMEASGDSASEPNSISIHSASLAA
jgi:hypothetical protein